MPRKNIYIRNGDLAAWEAIENKAEWLHDRLNSNTYESFTQIPDRLEQESKIPGSGVTKTPPELPIIKTKEDAEKAVAPIKKPPITVTPKTNWGA